MAIHHTPTGGGGGFDPAQGAAFGNDISVDGHITCNAGFTIKGNSIYALSASDAVALYSNVTTGNISIGGALTTGAITFGVPAGTGSHLIQSGTASGTATLRIANSASATNVQALRLINSNDAANANKAVDLEFAGDAAGFVGFRIRAKASQAQKWNHASQRTEVVFSKTTGTTMSDVLKIDPLSRLVVLGGYCSGYTRLTTGTAATVGDSESCIIYDAAFASHTLTMPAHANLADGMEIVIAATAAVTTFTLAAGAGSTGGVLNAPTTLAAGDRLCYKYLFSQLKWVRIG